MVQLKVKNDLCVSYASGVGKRFACWKIEFVFISIDGSAKIGNYLVVDSDYFRDSWKQAGGGRSNQEAYLQKVIANLRSIGWRDVPRGERPGNRKGWVVEGRIRIREYETVKFMQ